MTPERPRDIIEDRLGRHCGALFFISSLRPPIELLHNATYGLLDTGEKKLLLTCCHVWDLLQELRQTHREAQIAINLAPGLSPVISEAKVIDSDRDLDIAVIDPKLEAGELGDRAFFKMINWPQSPIQTGEAIAFLGYPEAGRVKFERHAQFRSTFFGLHVSSVNDRSILLLNNDNDRRLVGLHNEPLAPTPTSGLSGSPAYRLGSKGPELVGIVRGGFSTDGIITMTHISFLNRDGTLRK
jgi:hypothetical protein